MPTPSNPSPDWNAIKENIDRYDAPPVPEGLFPSSEERQKYRGEASSTQAREAFVSFMATRFEALPDNHEPGKTITMDELFGEEVWQKSLSISDQRRAS